MFFDLPPEPPKLWLPPKPAIIRPAERELIRRPSLARKLLRGASGVLPTFSYIGQQTSNSDLTTYTFAASDIGTADASRLVVVGVMGSNSSNIFSSGLIGGVSVSIVAQSRATCLISASVPTGTTGDIELTFAGGQTRAVIGVWALYNLSSTTPIDTDANSNSDPTINTTRTSQLDMTADAIAVAVGRRANTTSITVSDATQRFDVSAESTTRHAGGDYQATGVETRTITMQSVSSIAGAAWR